MSRLLYEGLSGDDVKMLQAVLNYHCVAPFDEILPVTGYFGSMTKRRVESFQRHNLLLVDGKVGPQTSKALMTICRASVAYVVTRDELEIPVGGGENADAPVSTEYELKDGLIISLNPWKSPPAKLQYRLEYDVSWVVKNPNLPAPFTLTVGAEIGRTMTTHSLDAPYTFDGSGHVMGKFEKDFTLGPLKLDAGVQAGFELEHETNSPDVQISAAASLTTGISFAVLRNRFYLFTQGELGAAVHWENGTVQSSPEWDGTAGFRLTF